VCAAVLNASTLRDAAGGRPDPFGALNAQQRAAVEHGMPDAKHADALLVIAGAGSGKTLTLASRVARLVLAGADPQRILLLTFSRRAAYEMERRVGRVLHQALGFQATQRAPQLHWCGTFHGIGARLLREYAPRIGLADDFTIHDRADSEDLIGLLRHDLKLAQTRNRFPLKATCLAIYSRVLNTQAGLAQVLHETYPWCAAWEAELKALFRAYTAEKQQQHVLDYDDLLLWWQQMLAEPALAAELGARFDHVLVDEYQDTNRLQAAILLALKPDGRGLTVVGDDAQSIYSFRGAEVRNILDFPNLFGPQRARIVALERNYRSTPAILDASNAVIAQAAQRHAKELWSANPPGPAPGLVTVRDESDQAAWIADEVLRQREAGHRLTAQAVLFRTSHHSAALELELARRQIPFVKYGGLKFLESAHVKDVLAVLRWAQNPRSRMAGLRVAQLVGGIGAASAKRLLDAVAEAEDPGATIATFQPPPAAREAWAEFVALYASLRTNAETGWPDELRRVREWYSPQLARLHDDAPAREADLAQLVQLAGGYASRERFLTELTLDPPQSSSDESGEPLRDEDYLILSTLHSAKGQEWSCVYILNVVDGCIPSDMATGQAHEIDEERRLLYVGMTRAKHALHLVAPQRFYVTQQNAYGDRHMYASLSRFLTPPVRALCSATSPAAPGDDPVGARKDSAPTSPVDLSARVRTLWS